MRYSEFKNARISLIFGFSAFVLSALSIGIIPLLQIFPEKVEFVLDYVVAGLFWAGIVSGIVLCTVVSKRIMRRSRRRMISNGYLKGQKLPGIITFSSDNMHMTLYGVLVLGILVMISDMVFHYVPQYIMFPVISIVFLTFVVHCITDGKNYKLYKAIKEGMDRDYEI